MGLKEDGQAVSTTVSEIDILRRVNMHLLDSKNDVVFDLKGVYEALHHDCGAS